MHTTAILTKVAFVAFCTALLAGASDVDRLLASSCNSASNNNTPDMQSFDRQVTEQAVASLSASELAVIQPIARVCLRSGNLEVRRYGMLYIVALSLRPDSAAVLEPLLDDIEQIAKAPNPLRQGALYILGSTYPHPTPRAVDYLKKHLEQSDLSEAELQSVAVSLIEASRSDNATRRKVFEVVDRQKELGPKESVLTELGLERASDKDSQAYIRKSLRSDDTAIRLIAMRSVEHFEATDQAEFTQELTSIADNPDETPENRQTARRLLGLSK